MAFLELNNVEKYYDDMQAVKGVDLKIEQGEFIVFVGPSGSGKSTLLNMVAGLEEISGGNIVLDNTNIATLESSKRDLAMVSQSFDLYSHMTVQENMSFALRLAKMPEQEIEEKVALAADKLDLVSLLKRLPRQLSGGQKQRVAIGRAFVKIPKLFLFDEPLSNLDASLRGQIRVEIASLNRDLSATTLYVTNDQTEAMTLADRVVVLKDGEIQQVGTPKELYEHPANRFVAQFIGMPQVNILPVHLNILPIHYQKGVTPKGACQLGIRPEHLSVTEYTPDLLKGYVEFVEPLGSESLIHVNLAGDKKGPVVIRQHERCNWQAGDVVSVVWDNSRIHFFNNDGQTLKLASSGAL
ncbi:ABC transporter ATP-binding protein [Leucothrix arctica]|uniref:ABC transporter ATP-binding protein n=1 Tax=Leucothrix arctica TaxID=1481894 RepID=A0A317CAX7_9GAMM|nr:ATP-binding cassette domain-containing protein [Leucothrix arctica]PWQ95698.1 ABC transporter ATP-binding protein [Leucothrix arctica]